MVAVGVMKSNRIQYILRMKLMGFFDGLNEGCERKTPVKSSTIMFSLISWKMDLPLTAIRRYGDDTNNLYGGP